MTTTFQMVDGDLHFDVNGRVRVVSGFEKVSQDLSEVLLTTLDVDRDFGSELPSVDADPAFNVSKQQVSTFVADAVERLKNMQRTSLTTTLDEEIVSIDAIEVVKNDQTEIIFGLSVSTASGTVLASSARLAKPVALNHLLPPSSDQLTQEIRTTNSTYTLTKGA